MDQPVGVPPTLRRNFDENQPRPEDVQLSLSLSQNQFVGTASNRQDEARRYTGWNYVGISAVCKLASRATVEIFDDRIDQGSRKSSVDGTRLRVRKSLMASHGSVWKSFAKDSQITQQADPSFRWWKLLEQPNPWQVGSQLRYTAIQQLRLHGIAMVWNVKNMFGKTVWRIPIPMALVQAMSPGSRRDMPMGGITVHSYGWMQTHFRSAVSLNRQLQYVASREISVDDLTIYAYPHPFLPGDGASPTTAIQSWLDLANQAEVSQADQYDRGPDRKVIVTPPEDVVSTEELRAYQKRLDKMAKETDTGIVVAAHGGVHDLTVSPDDMGYTQASDTFGSAILGAHGTPKSAVGMNDSMTYGSVSASIRAFGTLSVQSDLDTLADEDTMQMRAEEGPAFSVGYPCPPFDDPELKETQLTNDMSAGAITVGEWRIERGKEPFGDERDDLPAGGQAILAWTPQGMAQPGAPGGPGAPGQPGAAAGGVAPPAGELGAGLARIMGGADASPRGRLPARPVKPPATELGAGLAKIMAGQPKSLLRAVSDRSVRPYVVAVDLDGTLTVDGEYDERTIGAPRTGMVEAVRALRDAGCGIIIFTCRESDSLVAAWCDEHDVPFDAINANPWSGVASGKVMADLYLDNRAVSAEGPDAVVMAAVMDAVSDQGVRDAIRDSVRKRRFDQNYGFLFIPIDGGAVRIADEGRGLINPKHLAGDGIEQEPHITLLNAVAEKPWTVTDPLRAIGKFGFEVGRLDVFKHDDGTAHVVVRVSGAGLHDAYRLCEQSLTHMASEYGFNPHITIAVVKAKYADQYQGRELSMTGAVANVSRLIYRPPGEGDLVIPLR